MAIAFSQCFNGLKYSFATEPATFNEAVDICRDRGGQLAIPSSIDRFEFLLNEIINQGEASGFMGLSTFGQPVFDSISFLGIDGEVNPFTAVGEFGQFPWGEVGNETCIELLGTGNLVDISCSSERFFTCEHYCSSSPQFVMDFCRNGKQFFLNRELQTHDEAAVNCKSIDSSATLAVPESLQQLDQMRSSFSSLINGPFAHVGVRDYLESSKNISLSELFGGFGDINITLDDIFNGTLDGYGNFNGTIDDIFNGTLNDILNGTLDGYGNFNGTIDDIFNGTLNDIINGTLNDIINGTLDDLFNGTLDGYGNFNGTFDGYGGINITIDLEQLIVDLTLDAFFGADGSSSPFLRSSLPWVPGEPNNLIGTNFCALFGISSTKLSGGLCERLAPSICERECVSGVDDRFAIDTCKNNIQFYFNPNLRSFFSATSSCASLGGQLAIPNSFSKFLEMRSFRNGQTSRGTWIGLRDFSGIGGTSATRFIGVDGKANPATTTGRTFPWNSGEPNDSVNEDCVEISGSGLNDLTCSRTEVSLCERFCGERPDFVFGECIEDIQFFFNPSPRTFDGARADCQAFDATGELAIPLNAAAYQRITTLYEENRESTTSAYIGFADFRRFGGATTSRFRSPQGSFLSFASPSRGVFPWNVNEPNDATGVEHCAGVLPTSNLLNDFPCDRLLSSVCERKCVSPPTPQPTQNPTKSPIPTPEPTLNPTQNPTSNPTLNPTLSPVPTPEPTLNPTSDPTTNPTTFPTRSPVPTPEPTLNPTQSPVALIQGECVDGIRYLLNPSKSTFTEALERCKAFSENATLAQPKNSIEFNRLASFLSTANPSQGAILGFRDIQGIGGFANTRRFLSTEGLPVSFVNGNFGQFPWNSGEPNDQGSEDCSMYLPVQRRMNDFRCAVALTSACEVPCILAPTESPTSKPTRSPVPTSKPTLSPIQKPTVSPTINPTRSPVPTSEPTVEPTSSPTKFPTLFPTANPTKFPTSSPTPAPTIDCVNGKKYFYSPFRSDFANAHNECQRINPDARLAQPESIENYRDLEEFYFVPGRIDFEPVLLGYRDYRALGGISPKRFLNSNGEEVSLLNGTRGVFPWNSNEPNDLGGRQDCVIFNINGNLNDAVCTDSTQIICEVDCKPSGIPVTEAPAVDPRDHFVVGECQNNVQYSLNTKFRNVEEASLDCLLLSPASGLAVPRSRSSLNQMLAVLRQLETTGKLSYLGLRDFFSFNGGTNTERFLDFNFLENRFTSGSARTFPWGPTQPDDLTRVENCVALDIESGLLFDVECSNTFLSICETPCDSVEVNTAQVTAAIGASLLLSVCLCACTIFLCCKCCGCCSTTLKSADVHNVDNGVAVNNLQDNEVLPVAAIYDNKV